jgi:hypothetical protein
MSLIAILLFIACHDQSALSPDKQNALTEQIEQVMDIGVTPQNGDSLKGVWMGLLKNPAIQKDTVLATRVYYNLARLYGMQEQDSAKFYIERALELIEPTAGNLKEKALVYNGIGNISSMESKVHEESYYYNKAAAIVISDSTVDLSPEAKSAMLLSAAQSNGMTFQLDLAEKMNRAAIPLCDSLPEGHINRQRVLVQMIQVLSSQEKPDSIAPYLQKLEALQMSHPDRYNASFLYESKVNYFELTSNKDSLLRYQLMKSHLDEKAYHDKPASSMNINNLFIDYCNVAATNIVLKKPSQASAFLAKARQLNEKHKGMVYASNEIFYQKDLAALYKLQKKKDAAIDLLSNTLELEKKIYETENTQAVAEMNALYQLQSKDRSIRTLNESIEINQLLLQQNRLWLAVSVLGVFLLGATLLTLYYSFRQRRTRQEKEKVLLQQQLLRTQMEPHFIFNTLSAVQSFVRLDQKDNAIKYLNRFGRLLRSSLELSRENLVPLNEEIETLENYLSLQQMRFDNAFTYHIEQPQGEDLNAAMLPPMLVQPYVENAILHGIDLAQENGNIAVCFQLEDDIVQVTIADSGKTGIPPPESAHRSLSGTISRERIHLLGKKANIKSISVEGGGTLITLRIPIVYGNHRP